MDCLCDVIFFQKVTGKDLHYTAVLGKPSEVTYRFAEDCLFKEAQRLKMPPPKTMYMIGSVLEY